VLSSYKEKYEEEKEKRIELELTLKKIEEIVDEYYNRYCKQA